MDSVGSSNTWTNHEIVEFEHKGHRYKVTTSTNGAEWDANTKTPNGHTIWGRGPTEAAAINDLKDSVTMAFDGLSPSELGTYTPSDPKVIQ